MLASPDPFTTTTTNALGHTTEYKYNRLNQRVETSYADGTVVKEIKNISGLPTSKIDENLNGAKGSGNNYNLQY
ncbi:MAG: RHS repeat domain-containing protein [Campylobacterota bacterium]|nr:RHS repeat domain-containing protein [Campylobacterota bacterium]